MAQPMLELTPQVLTLSTALQERRPYYVGDGILGALPSHLSNVEYDKLYLVTSPELNARFGGEVSRVLHAAGMQHTVITFPEGESNKGWATLEYLCERLVAAEVTRDSVLISLGGGVISNLVGLASALVFRGLRYIDMPTTLMAQTDGVLSNKQAINGSTGKNQFGVYYAPLFIFVDVAYVRSEPVRQVRSAIVEGVKNGFVSDAAWLGRLASVLEGGLDGVYADLPGFVLELVESKLEIIRDDPTERGHGLVLEYGHTCGHAIEWLMRGELCHGEAVAMGMCFAARLGHRLGVTPGEVVDHHLHLLRDLLQIPIDVPAVLEPAEIYATMRNDNKRRGGYGVRFLLLEDVARPYTPAGEYLVPVTEAAVLEELCRS